MKPFDKKNPFQTPEGYFDEFDKKLFDKLSSQNTVIPKKEGFNIPEGYLHSFNAKLLQKLETEQESKVIPLNSYKKYYYAIAAMAAILVIALSITLNKNEEIGFDDLAEADIEAYFDQNGLGLTSYELAEVVPVTDLEITDMFGNNFSDENLLEYINENTDYLEELNLEDNE